MVHRYSTAGNCGERSSKSAAITMTRLSAPTNITVETTASCQLRCPACPTPSGLGRPRGMFSLGLFEQLLAQVHWPIEALSFGWSGEPLLNLDLWNMIAKAHNAGMPSYVSTNGLLLEKDCEALLDAGLDVLRICLDGTNQEMASKYRVGTDFDRVIRGTQQIVARRKARNLRAPRISLQMLVTQDTEGHLDEFIALAVRCGVDEVYFKSFNLSLSNWLASGRRQEMAQAFLPHDQRFLRYQVESSGDWKLRPEILATPCPEVSSGVTILHTGDVVPCCEDFGGQHILGNITRRSLSEIWKSEAYSQLRQRVYSRQPAMCRDCSYPGSDQYNRVVDIPDRR